MRKIRGLIFKIISGISLIGITIFSFSINLNIPTWFWVFLAISVGLIVIDAIDGGIND